MSKKWMLGLLLAGLVSVTAACGDVDQSAENNEGSDLQEELAAEDEAAPVAGEMPEVPEPDLEGIPDVVAEVNGQEISKEEFEATYVGQFTQAAMQSQMFGQELNQDELKQQIIESLVGQELLIQEAKKAGFEATEEDVSKTLDEIVAQYGLGSKEEFMTAIEEQGMDETEVISQLETQVKVDKLIARETGDIDPSEQELKEFYEQILAQQAQMGADESEIPSFEDIKNELKEQMKVQKQNEAAQVLVGKLREEADVTIHI
ncbi:SurA N-terminal domain-containing protein [Alkalihalobacterium elongatum]|uniref:SurA N-terminal domain-containing protein n=1 Tax=Alkalihalobacterium elongatum TaxID=2675466 RepID=UPI001C1FEEA3|nr:SurA N-terminal domain-containing protein [Alkalihalobacterium elongatum]